MASDKSDLWISIMMIQWDFVGIEMAVVRDAVLIGRTVSSDHKDKALVLS